MIINIVLKAEVSKTFSTGKRKERDHRNNENYDRRTDEQRVKGTYTQTYRRTEQQYTEEKKRERERERGKERSIKNRSTEVNLAEEQKK